MNKEDISWVVGEAIHFAYEMGCIDTMQNRGQANFDKQVDYVLEHLNNDSERDTLKEILSRELQESEEEEVAKIAVLGCKRNPQAHTMEECYNCIFKDGGCDSYTHAEILYSLGYRK